MDDTEQRFFRSDHKPKINHFAWVIFIIAEIAAYLFLCWTIIKLNKCWKRLRKRKKNMWRKHPNIQTSRQRRRKSTRKKRRKAKQIFPQPLESNLIMVLKQVEKRHWHCQRISFTRNRKKNLIYWIKIIIKHGTSSVEIFASKHIHKKTINCWMAALALRGFTVLFFLHGDISYSRLISSNCNKKCFFLRTN